MRSGRPDPLPESSRRSSFRLGSLYELESTGNDTETILDPEPLTEVLNRCGRKWSARTTTITAMMTTTVRERAAMTTMAYTGVSDDDEEEEEEEDVEVVGSSEVEEEEEGVEGGIETVASVVVTSVPVVTTVCMCARVGVCVCKKWVGG